MARMLSIFLLIVTSLPGCVGYLWQAGRGQAEILTARVPIAELLNEESLDPALHAKLLHIEEVRRFAGEVLHLDVGNTYTLYADIGRESLSFNVTASRELAFEPYTWWFPIVGRVPYLGFFDRRKADRLADRLADRGFDVEVHEVTAYSTLGFFRDPLLSTHLRLSEVRLTELLIHESAHATVWIQGDVSFNESYATFVEQRGTVQFYSRKDPARAKEILEYYDERRRLTAIFLNYTQQLDTIYRSEFSDEEKRMRKGEVLEALSSRFLAEKENFRFIDMKRLAQRSYNNASLASWLRYSSGESFFDDFIESVDGDWNRFHERIADTANLSTEKRNTLLHSSGKE